MHNIRNNRTMYGNNLFYDIIFHFIILCQNTTYMKSSWMRKPYDYEDIYSCLCLSYFVTNVKANPNPFYISDYIKDLFFCSKFNFWEIANKSSWYINLSSLIQPDISVNRFKGREIRLMRFRLKLSDNIKLITLESL